MSPAHRRTPQDLEALGAEDLAGPISDVRPRVSLSAVPRLTVTVAGLRLLPLDSRAAYLLSLVDGHCSVETILDICDMQRDEALDILARMLRLGAIDLRDP